MAYQTFDIETFKACVTIVNKTSNGENIKQALIDGKLSSTLINCTNILDLDQIKLAVFKALTSQCQGKLVTRNVYSEILYQLAPNKQISQAFKVFGMQASDQCFVAITIGDSRESDMKQVLDMAAGECLSLDEISNFNSIPTIKKTYKIEDKELSVGTLSQAVVSRIAAKELVM